MATSVAKQSDTAEHLFTQAIALPPEDRDAFLLAAAGYPSHVLAAAREMLRNFERLSGFLESPIALREPLPILEPGAVLAGRFRIERFIALGGMGEVYEAHDLVLGEAVAVKTIRSELHRDRQVIEQFRDEIRLSRKISHRNICRIHDVYEHILDSGDPLPFLSMELLDGETLADRLKKTGRMRLAEARPIVEQLLAGLAEAHVRGIVHRDFKPGNVMLTSRGAVITDFGLAQVDVSAPTAVASAPAGIAGSVPYMAPEQFVSARVTQAADIFSLGVVMYQMVSGELPFPAAPIAKALEARLSAPPAPPPALRRPILRCLRPNPADRPETIEDLAREISGGRLSRRVVVTGGAVAAAAAVVGSRWWVRSDVPPGLPLLLLETVAGDGNGPLLDALLRTQLGQSSHFEILSGQRIAAALTRMGNESANLTADRRAAREVALREGTPLVISPELHRTAGLRLQVEIEKLGSHPYFALASWKRGFEADSERDLRTAVTEAAVWIRRSVGEQAADLERRNRRPEEATTHSWEALLDYVAAEQARLKHDDAEAIRRLRQALAADDEFPLARMRLADILFGLNRSDEAYTHWSRAAALVESRRLTDRESFRIRALFYHDTGDERAAKIVMENWAADFPHDFLPLFYLSSCQKRLGLWKEALASIQAAAARAPGNQHVVLGHAQLCMEEGDLAGARTLLDSVREVNTWWWQYEAEFQFLSGDCVAARGCFDRLAAAGPEWRSKSYSLKACLFAECGRDPAALSILQEGIAFDRSTERVQDQAPAKALLIAALALRLGDRQTARLQSLAAVSDLGAREGQTGIRLRAAALLCRAGDHAAASRIAATAVAPDFPTYRTLRRIYLAEAALTAGRTADAIALFREAGQWMHAGAPADRLARALDLQGARPAASDLWSVIAALPGRYWLEPERHTPGVYRDSLTFLAATDPAAARRLQALDSQGARLG
jgi:tRNA A-37 threonylcarbamoyl transferase component Bud32/tetratricopeptide (TPR) repeat protein